MRIPGEFLAALSREEMIGLLLSRMQAHADKRMSHVKGVANKAFSRHALDATLNGLLIYPHFGKEETNALFEELNQTGRIANVMGDLIWFKVVKI